MKYLLAVVGTFVFLYLCTAFINAELMPTLWTETTRFFYVLGSCMLSGWVCMGLNLKIFEV